MLCETFSVRLRCGSGNKYPELPSRYADAGSTRTDRCTCRSSRVGAVIPITLFVIFPTNKELLDPATAPNLDRVRLLLARWNRLYAIRSALSTIALVMFLILLA